VPVEPTSKVRFDPSVPLHHQVYLQLRSEIADGLWADRSDFPGERELAERLGISVITTKAGLDRLASEGWIERHRGRRTRVVRDPVVRRTRSEPPIYAVGPQRSYEYRVLSSGVGIAPAEACSTFGQSPGHQLWQCQRLRVHGGTPHSVTHNAQLPDVGERHTARQLTSLPMGLILTREGYDVTGMRRRFGVTYPPPVVAEALGVTVAERVLVSTFTVHDVADTVVEWVRIYLHPDQPTPDETVDLTTGRWSATEPI
jgi:GntR family transcriptional regulator